MSNITNKEYLKKYITKAINGEIKTSDIQAVRNVLMNYSREEWKELIATGKELAAEAIEEEATKSKKIPETWKKPLKDLLNSMINLTLVVVNEEVLYQSMRIEKEGVGLSDEEKIIKILPIISQQIEKVAARANSVKVSNQYSVEKSLVNKKIKPLVSDIASKVLFRNKKKWSQEKAVAAVDKWINILKSLTAEEIKLFKWKINNLALKLVDNYAPSQIKNSPEIMGSIKSGLKLMDAIGDEKLAQDGINLVAKVWEKVRQSSDVEETLEELPTLIQQNPGLEEEFKNYIISISQHFNKLAREGNESPSLPDSQKEVLFQKLTSELSTSQPNPESLGQISWTNNLVKKGFDEAIKNLGSSQGDREFDLNNLLKDFNSLTKIETKPKWYQNPWIIVPSLIGAVVLGSLITWLCLRKKEPERDYKKY